jgi:hypothetical protein
MSERYEWTDGEEMSLDAQGLCLRDGEFWERVSVRLAAKFLRLAARVKELEAGERQRQTEMLHGILIAAAHDRVESRTDSVESCTKAMDAKLAELRKGAPRVDPPPLCDGCSVREPFEHRCAGAPCPCEGCREADRLCGDGGADALS